MSIEYAMVWIMFCHNSQRYIHGSKIHINICVLIWGTVEYTNIHLDWSVHLTILAECKSLTSVCLAAGFMM